MEKHITICLGSSCFSRGNKQTVNIIKEYIKSHQLEDKVSFRGNHCNNNCANGPIIIVDDKEYQHVSPENVSYLLENLFRKE